MKELVNLKSIDTLKKSRLISITIIVATLVVTISLMVPLFLFASRNTRLLFNFLIAVIATIGFSIAIYLLVISIIPINNYIKLSNLSINGNKYLTKGKVVGIASKVTHFKGVAVIEIKVKDLEEENKEYLFFIEQSFKNEFKLDETYSFITYQSLIVSYE